MKESLTEQFIDQQQTSSPSCDYLSSKLDSIERDGTTEKNEDSLQLKSTKDDVDSPEKKCKSDSNSLETVNTKSQQPQETPTENGQKKKKVMKKKIKKKTPRKKRLRSFVNKSFKKNIKRFRCKFYKLDEYANFEDKIKPYQIEEFKKFRRKIIFKKNHTVYIVIKKKRDFLFNSLGNSNEDEEMSNLDEIANISSNHSHQININDIYDVIYDILDHLTTNCTD
jgi:hypothetical protein